MNSDVSTYIPKYLCKKNGRANESNFYLLWIDFRVGIHVLVEGKNATTGLKHLTNKGVST